MRGARAVLTTILVLGVAPVYAATISVQAAGGTYNNSQLQTAINAAACGDTITLQEGVTYTAAPFSLPDKDCTDGTYVTITSRVSDSSFPSEGVRVTSADDANMPIISSTGSGTEPMRVAKSGGHYRIKHLKFLGVVAASTNTLFAIGYGDSNQKFESEIPRYIDIVQNRFVGHPTAGQKRGVELNGNYVFIRDNDFDDFHTVGQDGQCIGGWNATGPWYITNNRLECATENFMVGGADPWVRLWMTTTGTPTTTSADVSLSDTSHDLSELNIGDNITVAISGGHAYTTVRSITGTGDTGTITFDAISSAPSQPGGIRWDANPTTIEFKYNLVEKDPEWEDGLLDGPSDLALSQVAGSGRSGTVCYAIASTAPGAGYGANEIHSAIGNNPCITLSGSGNVRLTFTPDALAPSITIWRGTSAGVYTHFCDLVPGAGINNTSPWDDTGDCNGATGGDGWEAFTTPPSASSIEVKNLFEIKSGDEITVEGNIFRHSWNGASTGKAWWIKHANQDDGCWSCGGRGSITFRNNRIEDVSGWFLIVSQERYNGAPYPTPMVGTITFSNNLVCESSGAYAMTVTRTIGGTFVMDHNTVDHASSGAANFEEAISGSNTFNYRSNKIRRGSFGMRDNTESEGTAAIGTVAGTVSFLNNSIADAPNVYPGTTLRPTGSNWQADFTNYTGACTGDWSLASGSDEKNAGHDGTDIGVNMTTLGAALDGVEAGNPTADDGGAPDPVVVRYRFRALD